MNTAFKKFIKTKMFTLLVILVVLIIVMTIGTSGYFIKLDNIKKILDSMYINSLLTIGAAMLLISGELDLSVGTVGTAGMVMLAFFLKNLHWPLIPALILTLFSAAVIGLINSLLVNKARFPSFIATLAMASVAQGLSYMFTGGGTVTVSNKALRWIGSGQLFGVIPISVIVVIVVFVIYGIILSKTKFGRQMYLVGGNPYAAKLSGINPHKVKTILFVNSACLATVAGIVLSARASSASLQGIKAQQFYGLTAAILGGVSFGGGTGGMAGAFVGLLIFTSFANGMVNLHINSWWNQVIYGLLLLAALTFDFFTSRMTMKKVKAS